MVAGANHDQVPTVAYVLKSFPRLPETFIAAGLLPYHGLNVEFARLCAERSRPTIPGGGVRVLAVGRLVEKKGFDVLLDACARLRQRDISVGATIVGEPGEHGAVLQEQAARPEMAKSMAREAQTAISTRFNGDVTARTLPALLQEAVGC